MFEKIKKRISNRRYIKSASLNNPISFGCEIEQKYEDILPNAWDEFDSHHDGSGPEEILLPLEGGVSTEELILMQFDDFVEAAGGPWSWRNELPNGNGCGSHLHISPIPEVYPDKDINEFRAIVYNTIIEMTPILSPFFSWGWRSPQFRGNTGHGVEYWASGNNIRFSTLTIDDRWETGYRNSQSVTINSSTSHKPVTIELRISETPPPISLSGIYYLREIISDSLSRWKSPRIKGLVDEDGSQFRDRGRTTEKFYDKIYNLSLGLRDAMKYPELDRKYIKFEDDRGIPGIGDTFINMKNMLSAIMETHGPRSPLFVTRVSKLLDSYMFNGNDAHNPIRNNDKVFEVYKTPEGEFSWYNGPEVR